jgi:hypothetical protein
LSSRPFNPISTLLVKIVEGLIASEPEPDEKLIKRIKWISENTHEEVKEPLSIIELVVFKNLDRGLSREVEISNKTYLLVELYKYLDEISKELTKIVIGIAKKFSLDIPINMGFGGSRDVQSISLE